MTALNSTTFAAAVTADATRVKLTSVTNAAVGYVLFAEGEGMLIQALNGVYADVFRGYTGRARAHASGAVVYTNPAGAYYQDDPVGAGTTASELYLPHINLQNGNAWTIVNGQWIRFLDRGVPVALPAGATTPYTAAGAITLIPGVHSINGSSALSMTLADPGANTPENAILVIVSGTAQAHTVTYTAGFAANTTSSDVATFGAAIGNSMTIQNIAGAWRVLSLNGVTLG